MQTTLRFTGKKFPFQSQPLQFRKARKTTANSSPSSASAKLSKTPEPDRLISKSGYITCEADPVRGLLSHYAPKFKELQTYLEADQASNQEIFDNGHLVGEFAQTLFPNGKEIEFEPGLNDPETCRNDADLTLKHMSDGVKAIYEATFVDEDSFQAVCHSDLIVEESAFRQAFTSNGLNISQLFDKSSAGPDTKWVLLEVKAATGPHMFDGKVNQTSLKKLLGLPTEDAKALTKKFLTHGFISKDGSVLVQFEREGAHLLPRLMEKTGLSKSNAQVLINEMKHVHKLRPEKRQDIAFQYRLANSTLQKAGKGSISDAYFVYPDRAYKKNTPTANPWDYFAFSKVTDEALAEQSTVEKHLPKFKAMLSDPKAEKLVESYIDGSQSLISTEKAPAYKLGDHNFKPFGKPGPFFDLFLKLNKVPFNKNNEPVLGSVFSLAGMPFKQKSAFFNSGITSISQFNSTSVSDLKKDALNDLPKAYQMPENQAKPLSEMLPATYRNQVNLFNQLESESGLTNQADIDFTKLHDFFKKVKKNVVALDFETMQRSIPIHAGTQTWYKQPFQVSQIRVGDVDVEKAKGVLTGQTGERLSFMNMMEYGSFPSTVEEFKSKVVGQDAREAMAEAMVDFIYNPDQKDNKETTILAWNASFERDRIQEMVDHFESQLQTVPDSETQRRKKLEKLSGGLKQILNNLMDLRDPFSLHDKKTGQVAVNHPLIGGFSSIKKVHPVIMPKAEVQYRDLDVHNGAEASLTFSKVEKGELQGADADKALADLITYCNFDSEATLQIFMKLWLVNHFEDKQQLFNEAELAQHQVLKKEMTTPVNQQN